MKSDMDYKEKYEQALQRAKQFSEKPFLEDSKGIVEYIFPELKESEDENTRKYLIKYITEHMPVKPFNTDTVDKQSILAWLEKQSTPQVRTGLEWVNTIDDACDKRYSEEYAHGEYCHEQSFKWGFQEGVDWLEKQGEQNPAENKGMNLAEEDMTPFQKKVFCIIDTTIEEEQGLKQVCDELLRLAHDEIMQKPAWSEEDEEIWKTLKLDIWTLAHAESKYWKFTKKPETIFQWISSLKNRVQPQPQQAWNEEDESMLQNILECLKNGWRKLPTNILKYESWLKSLRPQSHWKPSDLPHWKKSTLPNDNTTGFNSDFFCYKGYNINYKELFKKLPKDD